MLCKIAESPAIMFIIHETAQKVKIIPQIFY